jgi:hypothetical protein
MNMKRRTVLQAMLASASVIGVPLFANAAANAAAKSAVIDVYKTASCGCCEGWVQHLRDAGFTVKAHNVEDTSVYRTKYGIPEALGSCHTGVVNGYGIEGHVPAAEIKRLLAEKPKARGLTVPGMPVGSPGMEGSRQDAFDVLLVKADGSKLVYKHYN